jgi:hypothetical protein
LKLQFLLSFFIRHCYGLFILYYEVRLHVLSFHFSIPLTISSTGGFPKINNIQFLEPNIPFLFIHKTEKDYNKNFISANITCSAPNIARKVFNTTCRCTHSYNIITNYVDVIDLIMNLPISNPITGNTQGRLSHPMHTHGHTFYLLGMGHNTGRSYNVNFDILPSMDTLNLPING